MDCQGLALVDDGKRPIEAFVDHDARLGIAAVARAGQDLDEVLAEPDGVIVADLDRRVTAADGVSVHLPGDRTPGRAGLRGGVGKAAVEARQKDGADGMGLVPGAGAGEAACGNQAILNGPPEAFHAARGLRGWRAAPLDAQWLHSPADRRRWGTTGQFCLEAAGRARGHEDAVPVAVHGCGQALRAPEAGPQEEGPVGVLRVAALGEAAVAGGIVDGAEQDEAGAAGFEPGRAAPVEWDEQPGEGRESVSPARSAGSAVRWVWCTPGSVVWASSRTWACPAGAG